MSDDRPFQIALSREELMALVKYHVACARRVPKKLGQAALELQAKSLFPSGRALKTLHEVARKTIEEHATRAKGLASLLQS